MEIFENSDLGSKEKDMLPVRPSPPVGSTHGLGGLTSTFAVTPTVGNPVHQNRNPHSD